MEPTPTPPQPAAVIRYAYLCVNSFKGQRPQRVAVLSESPTRYRIQALTPTVLGGRRRLIQPGGTALVPKWSVQNSAPAVKEATSQPAASTSLKPRRFFKASVETPHGMKIRYYRAKTPSAARSQGEKVSDVVRLIRLEEIAAADYDAGTCGQRAKV